MKQGNDSSSEVEELRQTLSSLIQDKEQLQNKNTDENQDKALINTEKDQLASKVHVLTEESNVIRKQVD